MFQSRESRIEAERQIDFAEWIDPDMQDEWLTTPDPDDRFNWYAIIIILAAVACGVIAWGVV